MKRYIAITRIIALVCGVCSFSIVSCKSKAVLVSTNTNNSLSSDKIIEKHYNNKKDFSTLYIKSSAHYEDKKQSQNVNAEIKIKKDEMILISIRFLGITMAKALITPLHVKYYEKIGGTYFEGNYSSLSAWLGIELDYQKAQNMILGQALENLNKKKHKLTIEDNLYKLENISDSNITSAYFFEPSQFLIAKEQISQVEKERKVEIIYANYLDYDAIKMPTGLMINAVQKNTKTNINIEYNTVTFNEELSFPYSVPEGYERIFIN